MPKPEVLLLSSQPQRERDQENKKRKKKLHLEEALSLVKTKVEIYMRSHLSRDDTADFETR